MHNQTQQQPNKTKSTSYGFLLLLLLSTVAATSTSSPPTKTARTAETHKKNTQNNLLKTKSIHEMILNPYYRSHPFLNNHLQSKCADATKDCLECDSHNLCIRCREDRYLNITKTPPNCEPCPYECVSCGEVGCEGCEEGYYLHAVEVGNMISNTCRACDSNCMTCKFSPSTCLTCGTYSKLNFRTHRCEFKYAFAVGVGLVVTVLILIILIVVIARCICRQDKLDQLKLESQTMGSGFGTILDKDPELRSDHYKTEVKTIGMNDDSCISDVRRSNDSYLNISTMSKDKDLVNQLLGGSRSPVRSRGDSIGVHSEFDGGRFGKSGIFRASRIMGGDYRGEGVDLQDTSFEKPSMEDSEDNKKRAVTEWLAPPPNQNYR